MAESEHCKNDDERSLKVQTNAILNTLKVTKGNGQLLKDMLWTEVARKPTTYCWFTVIRQNPMLKHRRYDCLPGWVLQSPTRTTKYGSGKAQSDSARDYHHTSTKPSLGYKYWRNKRPKDGRHRRWRKEDDEEWSQKTRKNQEWRQSTCNPRRDVYD